MSSDATSIRELARQCGRGESTVRKQLQRRDWPVQREPPWSADDIAEVQAWHRTLQPDRSAQSRGVVVEPPTDDQTKDYWLMRKYRAQALQAEGELLAADVVRTAWVRTMAEIRQRCLLVPPAAASLCVGKDIAAVESVLDDAIRTALDDIADRVGDLADSRPDHAGGVEVDTDPAAAEAE